MERLNCAVVGGGVIGLSTAILALESGIRDVTVYMDLPTSKTTSSKAVASFEPTGVEYTNLTHQAVVTGKDRFRKILEQDPYSGVSRKSHWELFSSPVKAARYLELMDDVRIEDYPAITGDPRFGWFYKTFLIEMGPYLEWLVDRLVGRGGSMRLGSPFTSVEEFGQIGTDLVFNCSGLGAGKLCDDEAVHPVKGQLVVVEKIDPGYSVALDNTYCYPRRRDTVLGGSTEVGVWDEGVDARLTAKIITDNSRFVPGLSSDKIKKVYTGLRPVRSGGVRIEAEDRGNQRIIHNYGHGGAGVTLSWGTAELALALR